MATESCGCCGLFSKRRRKEPKPAQHIHKHYSEEHLLGFTIEEVDKATQTASRQAVKSTLIQYTPPYEVRNCPGKSVQHDTSTFTALGASFIGSQYNFENDGSVQTPVRYIQHVVRSEDPSGKKMINEYVRQYKIGTGSYGKVVLYRSNIDDNFYALKIFHKSRLGKLRVSPTETAMMDVLREVMIMKQIDHPNIVKLVEVIDDPQSDLFFMVLEYVERGWIFEGCGPAGGIGEFAARRYFRDVVSGLMYLHALNIIHGDIKPENLLIGNDRRIKICDFGVSRKFEDGNDELRRSPGTPVYSAPECCLGLTYHGKAADVWALGCTLYCMTLGRYPFKGESLESTYEKIVNDSLYVPEDLNPELADLLEGLLCKDAKQRLTLEAVSNHSWVVKGYGPVFQEV